MKLKAPLTGSWHHGTGVLVCGTTRIASADFDTNPSEQFQNEMFDWICEALNAAVDKELGNTPDEFSHGPDALMRAMAEIGVNIKASQHVLDTLQFATDWRAKMVSQLANEISDGIQLHFAQPNVQTSDAVLRLVEVLDNFGFSADDRRAVISQTSVAASH